MAKVKVEGECFVCGEPTDNFRCAECRKVLQLKGYNEYQREYRKNNRERIRAYHREYMRLRRATA